MFVIFFIISVLFLNLFIGVVIETFNRQKALLSYNHILRPSQRSYLQIVLLTFKTRPMKLQDLRAMNCLRRFCVVVTQHKAFEIFILTCILINTIVMASQYYMISDHRSHIQSSINLFFLAVFIIEAILKLFA